MPDSFQRSFGNTGGGDFAAGTVRGLRYWSVHPQPFTQGALGLHGYFSPMPWTPGENTAVCLANPGAYWHYQHGGKVTVTGPRVSWNSTPLDDDPIAVVRRPHPDVPRADCECGFYAYWATPSRTGHTSFRSALAVAGVIDGYGRTLIGDLGFRCGKARILGLHLSGNWPPPERDTVAAGLTRVYGVPVYPTMEELLDAYPATSDYQPKAA